MALTADKVRNYDASIAPMFADIPGKVSTTFYEGGACTDDGGNGEADVLTASEAFLGFVERQVITNSTTSDINVRLRQQGILKDVAVAGLDADTDLGVAVYAINNDSFTLTSSTTHVQIGKVQGYKGVSGYGDVFFQAAIVRSI
jgi:hypothetical protein